MMRAVPGISVLEPPRAGCGVMDRESVRGVVLGTVEWREDEGSVPPARALSLEVRPRRA